MNQDMVIGLDCLNIWDQRWASILNTTEAVMFRIFQEAP
jgi:hypothetical protein